jgi:peptidyl-prolyl cis-trans isomerase SurA
MMTPAIRFPSLTRSAGRRGRVRAGAVAVAAVAGAVAALVPATGSTQQRVALAEGVTAIVNDYPVTSFDVRQRTQFLLATSGIQNLTEAIVQEAAAAALDALINERLQLQEAGRYNAVPSDPEVDQTVARRAQQQGGSLQDFYAELGRLGVSAASYREQIKAEMAWQRIVRGRFGSRIRISRDRIDEQYARIVASAGRPQYLVSEIFLESAPGEQEATLAGAATLVQQIRAGNAAFQLVAQRFSFAPSAAAGGDLGWVGLAELRPQVAGAVEAMSQGGVSDPIVVEGGVMIVGLRQMRPGVQLAVRYTLKGFTRPVAEGAGEAEWRRAEQAVNQARSALRGGCDGVSRAATRAGVEASDFGQVGEEDLAEPFRAPAAQLQTASDVSPAFRSDGGVHALVLCARDMTGGDIPTREDLQDRLFDQEISLAARRYLRDLRREASIISR